MTEKIFCTPIFTRTGISVLIFTQLQHSFPNSVILSDKYMNDFLFTPEVKESWKSIEILLIPKNNLYRSFRQY